jgi:hypothetical protein
MLLLWCGFHHLNFPPLPADQVERDCAIDVPSTIASELSSVRAVVQHEASVTEVGVGAWAVARCVVAVAG